MNKEKRLRPQTVNVKTLSQLKSITTHDDVKWIDKLTNVRTKDMYDKLKGRDKKNESSERNGWMDGTEVCVVIEIIMKTNSLSTIKYQIRIDSSPNIWGAKFKKNMVLLIIKVLS